MLLADDGSLLVGDNDKLSARIFPSQACPNLLSEPLHLTPLDSHPTHLTTQGQVFHSHPLNFTHCLIIVTFLFFCLSDLIRWTTVTISLYIVFCILFGTASLLLKGFVCLN